MKRIVLALALVAASAAGVQAQSSQRFDDDGRRASRAEEPPASLTRDPRGDPRASDPSSRDQMEREGTSDLEARIDEAERDGRLTGRQAAALRQDLAQLESMREDLSR